MKNFSKDNIDLIIHKNFSDVISQKTDSCSILVNIIDKSCKGSLENENTPSLELTTEFELHGSRGLVLSEPEVLSQGYINIDVNFDDEVIQTPCQKMNITLGLKNTFIKKRISFIYIK